MRIFVNGECKRENIFSLVDPTAFSEADFEMHVKAALSCVYHEYHCFSFKGAFEFDGDVCIADLALVHRDFSHWFILEVELVSHSLHGHVIPQVRCFAYGLPKESIAEQLARNIPGCSIAQARTLLRFVPRCVAVVANRFEPNWVEVLRALNVQFMAVSVFNTVDGGYAVETEGTLNVPHVSLGFFTYSAPNRTIRVSLGCGLREGVIQIEDPYGVPGLWTVRASEDAVWITKNAGDPGIADNALLQLLKTQGGKLTLKLPPTAASI